MFFKVALGVQVYQAGEDFGFGKVGGPAYVMSIVKWVFGFKHESISKTEFNMLWKSLNQMIVDFNKYLKDVWR